MVAAVLISAWAGVAGTLLVGTATPAAAQTDADSLAEALDADGRYLEFASSPTLDTAIDNANSQGIAFAWLDDEADGDQTYEFAVVVANELAARLSTFRTVVILTNQGVAAESNLYDGPTVEASLNRGFSLFGQAVSGTEQEPDSAAAGLDAFVADLVGVPTGSGSTATTQAPSSGGSGGSGFPLSSLLLPLILLGGGFWMVRNWLRSRKVKAKLADEIAADKAEIREQLRDNADRVITLGDRVIEAGDQELISTYEKASSTYRDVSHAIDEVNDADEVDRLDDRIDEAEWQFEVIEARLEGRPAPPSPAELEAAAAEAAAAEAAEKSRQADKPALGPNDSIFDQRSAPQPRRSGYSRAPRRGGYGYGGGMGGAGGGLGGMLGSIILGQMSGTGRRSRRSQRRHGGDFGGLGGGVLRPRSGRSRSGGGGGGSFGGKRGGGGGRSF